MVAPLERKNFLLQGVKGMAKSGQKTFQDSNLKINGIKNYHTTFLKMENFNQFIGHG